MINMRQDGYFKALTGKTTLAEVDRVAAADNA
jgi:type II secretory ATPase GspE/PulE/Tfp pilus assembly ATPase PilB-like protein